MPAYWNALDCAIHVPRTSDNWVETFSLAIVQARATGKPIIGNSSGSVPYQIGPDGIVVEEKNIQALHDKISWVIEHPEDAKLIGQKMRNRAIKCFSVQHLNEMFYDTIIDIKNGVFDAKKQDMSIYKTE